MHEFSLAQAILDEVDRVRREHGGGRVKAFRIEAGELAGVETALLTGAIEMLLAGSSDEGAILELEAVPVEAHCQECGAEFRVQRFQFLCPHCGGGSLEVLRGEGLVLRDVTLERSEGSV